MKRINPIRPSPIAGTWYENRPEKLAAEIDAYLDEAGLPVLDGDVIGVVAPHAGYMYSGAVAGYAFVAVRNRKFDLVAVLSPFHAHHQDAFLTTSHTAYATPLGNVPVDRDVVNMLDATLHAELGFGITPIARDGEHSLEIELPFLQRALSGEFSLLPIMIRSTDAHELEVLGKALAKVLRERNVLLVASTDLSHFYAQDVAKTLDGEMLRQMESFSPEGVLEAEEMGKGFACGRGAVAATLFAARELGADSVKVLNYATSGDVTGDFSSVVGYGAGVIYKT
ncbi:MAG: AmmeMemoRadiSam system protein B [Anaerolineae bacterium]|jgi:MEMO1 family protein|nr:AmmeMemoRadiSam system protein B [Anaerolineae bacterium]MBT7069842.1 AmmeMemoRadiSam system protein B [Anaerolineae bacterium]MBT7325770.1 AmmeMemoRadiSam system protein B [Anaerolineae bacterium]